MASSSSLAEGSRSSPTLDLDYGPSEDASSDDWILIDDGAMKGVNIVVDNQTKEVMHLSTRFTRDQDRWMNNSMPSLEDYSSLRILDLHNSRYLTTLHDSVTGLHQLRTLILTKCDNLVSLPGSIGSCKMLETVRSVQFVSTCLFG